MSFEYIGDDHATLDMPPELAGLMGLEVAPLVVAGVAATIGTFAAWLAKGRWSTGEYNNYMRALDDTFKTWDKLGWVKGADNKSCWEKNPAKREQWLLLWGRFSKHYKENPVITNAIPILGFDPAYSREEGPARVFMAKMEEWGNDFFGKVCGADVGSKIDLDPGSGDPPPSPEGGPGGLLKYGMWIVGGLVALNMISGIRGLLPARKP